MATLQELLGDAYTPELEAELFADKDKELARVKGSLSKLDESMKTKDAKIKELETAALSESERLKKEVEDTLAAAKASEITYKKEMSKIKVMAGLQGYSVDAETLDALAGDDPEKAEKMAAGLLATIKAAQAATEAEVNAKHLKNNGSPDGNVNDKPMTKDDFEKLSYSQVEKLAQEHPDIYKKFTEG